jgi:prepilin-type N-terminal cleavage/methylation domain-containing protein
MRRRWAFTLIELLVVIAIIAILASLVFPVTWAVNRLKIQSRCKGEMGEIETWINQYKDKFGHYPPDNPGNYLTNQLFYELSGTTLDDRSGNYTTLDGSATIARTALSTAIGPGVGGMVNSTKGGGGDEGSTATKFISGLKPNQIATLINGPNTNIDSPTVLISVPWKQGPAPFNFNPVPGPPFAPDGTNPWRYNSSSPFKNRDSYDLWIDVMIGSKCYRICNWSSKPLAINSPNYP